LFILGVFNDVLGGLNFRMSNDKINTNLVRMYLYKKSDVTSLKWDLQRNNHHFSGQGKYEHSW